MFNKTFSKSNFYSLLIDKFLACTEIFSGVNKSFFFFLGIALNFLGLGVFWLVFGFVLILNCLLLVSQLINLKGTQ